MRSGCCSPRAAVDDDTRRAGPRRRSDPRCGRGGRGALRGAAGVLRDQRRPRSRRVRRRRRRRHGRRAGQRTSTDGEFTAPEPVGEATGETFTADEIDCRPRPHLRSAPRRTGRSGDRRLRDPGRTGRHRDLRRHGRQRQAVVCCWCCSAPTDGSRGPRGGSPPSARGAQGNDAHDQGDRGVHADGDREVASIGRARCGRRGRTAGVALGGSAGGGAVPEFGPCTSAASDEPAGPGRRRPADCPGRMRWHWYRGATHEYLGFLQEVARLRPGAEAGRIVASGVGSRSGSGGSSRPRAGCAMPPHPAHVGADVAQAELKHAVDGREHEFIGFALIVVGVLLGSRHVLRPRRAARSRRRDVRRLVRRPRPLRAAAGARVVGRGAGQEGAVVEPDPAGHRLGAGRRRRPRPARTSSAIRSRSTDLDDIGEAGGWIGAAAADPRDGAGRVRRCRRDPVRPVRRRSPAHHEHVAARRWRANTGRGVGTVARPIGRAAKKAISDLSTLSSERDGSITQRTGVATQPDGGSAAAATGVAGEALVAVALRRCRRRRRTVRRDRRRRRPSVAKKASGATGGHCRSTATRSASGCCRR